MELLEVLAEAEEDVSSGRVAPIKDTFEDLRELLNARISSGVYNF